MPANHVAPRFRMAGADRDRLDIVDRRRAAVEPDRGRERRFQARLALAPFEAFEEPGLLAADIGAGAAMQVEVDVVARAAGVLAEEPGVVGFLDRGLEVLRLVVELAADVDVGRLTPIPTPASRQPSTSLCGS